MTAALIAFALPIAFVPWWAGAATSPKWAVAAVSLYYIRWPALAFIAICFWRLGFDSAVHWAIITAAFCWRPDLKIIVPAFAVGIAVNSLAVIAQHYGWTGVPQLTAPAGLFLNKNVLAECAALATVALVVLRMNFLWLVAVAPALILTNSKGAWLATACGLALLLPGRYKILALLCGVGALAFGNLDTLQQRFMLWEYAVQGLSWLGSGDFTWSTVNYREPNVHNDFLQLIYELGVFAILPIGVFGVALTNDEYRPLMATAAVLATFSFPMHSPASAWFIGCAAGSSVGFYTLHERAISLYWLVTEKLFGTGHSADDLSAPALSPARASPRRVSG